MRSHEFFQGIDWDQVLARQVPSQYKPTLDNCDEFDTSNFDPSFTQMEISRADQHSSSRKGNIIEGTSPIFTDQSCMCKVGKDENADSSNDQIVKGGLDSKQPCFASNCKLAATLYDSFSFSRDDDAK